MTTTATIVPTGTWTADTAHSTVGFAVKHMGIATVRGEFTDFDGTLEVGEDLSAAKAYGTVKVASRRHRGAAARRPPALARLLRRRAVPGALSFESTRIETVDDETFQVTGDLTLHGVTKEVTLARRGPGHRRGPVGQRARRPRDHRPALARRLRHEVQPGAGQWQHAGRRQGQRSRSTSRRSSRPSRGLSRRAAGGGLAPRPPPPARPPTDRQGTDHASDRRHPPHHADHRRRAPERRLLRARARPAAGQEDRQPGRPERLPPLLLRREGLAGRGHHVLRVPGRGAGPRGRGHDRDDRPPRRLRGGARLLGRAALRRGRRRSSASRACCASPIPRACGTSSRSSRPPTRR